MREGGERGRKKGGGGVWLGERGEQYLLFMESGCAEWTGCRAGPAGAPRERRFRPGPPGAAPARPAGTRLGAIARRRRLWWLLLLLRRRRRLTVVGVPPACRAPIRPRRRASGSIRTCPSHPDSDNMEGGGLHQGAPMISGAGPRRRRPAGHGSDLPIPRRWLCGHGGPGAPGRVPRGPGRRGPVTPRVTALLRAAQNARTAES